MRKQVAWVAALAVLCGSFAYYMHVSVASAAVDTAALTAQLNAINAEIDSINKDLQVTQKQQTSLERDLSILDNEIQKTKLEIQRRNLTIQQLSASIQSKENNISGLNDKLQNEYESLAAILRETNQLDTSSLVIAALTANSLSNFFSDLGQFSAISEGLQNSFATIRSDRQVNEEQKADLESKLEEQTQLRQVQQLQQQQLRKQEAEKNEILKATKGQEKAYQQLIASKRQSAAQIQAALFELTGTSGKGIPFSQAYEYAKLAEEKTGVRPAFLLGLITEESGLGKNVGTGSWVTDMHPTRDRPVFTALTTSLGLNPDSMPVSKKAWYGWGGAMGPAQFIPSTWVCYAGYVNLGRSDGKCGKNPDGTWNGPWKYDASRDEIGSLTGSTPPNPWNPKDAFMAAAIYLSDSGASKQTYAGEFKAAMCYLAGCANANKADLQFYGTDVMGFALEYQCQIDIINGKQNSASCSAVQ